MTHPSSIHAWLLRAPNFADLSQDDQVEVLAYFFTKVSGSDYFKPKDVSKLFEDAKLSAPSNIHQCFGHLKKIKRILLHKTRGYCISRERSMELDSQFGGHTYSVQTVSDLRKLLPKINNDQSKDFLTEAINCFEKGSYRACILMVWLLVVDSLYDYVLRQELAAFNASAAKKNSKIRPVAVKVDFFEIKESEFIEICRSAKILTNDRRKILDEKLGIRNTVSHPNDIKISESRAISFVEDLINNILLKYV